MEQEIWERKPRILLYDLEVTPLLGWTYGEWNTNVIQVEQYSYILCFSYKWLDEKEVHSFALPEFIRYKDDPTNDIELVKHLWRLMDQADILIAHNNDRFDMIVANARFAVHNLTPPSPSKTVDTLKAARRFMRFSSNRLDSLGRQLEIGRKTNIKHSDLWYGCINGNETAWKRMVKYCEQDVKLLEKLYLRLRPYIKNHPNVATLSMIDWACPKCGHKKLQRRGYAATTTYTYQRYSCKNCGGWGRYRISEREIVKPDLVNEQ